MTSELDTLTRYFILTSIQVVFKGQSRRSKFKVTGLNKFILGYEYHQRFEVMYTLLALGPESFFLVYRPDAFPFAICIQQRGLNILQQSVNQSIMEIFRVAYVTQPLQGLLKKMSINNIRV